MKRVLRSLLLGATALGIVLTGPITAANAAPSPSSVENQIDQQWNKLEPIIEQYNDVHNKLQANRAQLAKIQKRLTPLEVQVNVALSQVRGMAKDAYMAGSPGAMSAIMLTGSPTGFTEKLSFLDQYARHQRDEISDVAKLRDQLAGDKQDLDTLTQAQAVRDAELAKTKATIEQKISDLQKLRIKAYGASGGDDGAFRLGPCPVTYTNDKGGRAAQKACDLIGKPYIFGSEGPTGYDCSGLTKIAWGAGGGPRAPAPPAPGGAPRPGRPAARRPGDLVFYFPGSLHHVSIYIGGGMVVHAPHTGDHVRMAAMDLAPIAGYRRPS